MSTCTLTLDLGYGADIPFVGRTVKVERVVPGDNGSMWVTTSSESVTLTASPLATIVVEQGVYYQFVHPDKSCHVKLIPGRAMANYSDVDLPDINPDTLSPEVEPEAAWDVALAAEAQTRAAADVLLQPKASLAHDVGVHVSDGSELDLDIAAKIAKAAGVESTDFTLAGSVPTVADTGQAVAVTGGGTWRINHNALCLSGSSGSGAAYFQRAVNGLEKITALYRRFRINSGGSTDGQGVAMIAWEGLFSSGPVPQSHCHAVITRTSWALSVLDAGSIVGIANDVFAASLPLDTVLESTITISGDTATWALPDGNVVRIKDPRIASIRGYVAVDEITSVNLATDHAWEILQSYNSTRTIDPPITPAALWKPSENGLVAANGNPADCIYSTALIAAAQLAVRVRIPAGKAITNVDYFVGAAGSGLTYGQIAVVEKGAPGTVVGITGSLVTPWSSIGAKKSPLGTPVPAKAYERDVWFVFAVTGTTPPSIAMHGGPSFTTANLGLGSVGFLNAGYFIVAAPIGSTCNIHAIADYFQLAVGAS